MNSLAHLEIKSQKYFQKPATTERVIDNKKMSSMIKCPCAYCKNNFGNIILNISSEHTDTWHLVFLTVIKNHKWPLANDHLRRIVCWWLFLKDLKWGIHNEKNKTKCALS